MSRLGKVTGIMVFSVALLLVAVLAITDNSQRSVNTTVNYYQLPRFAVLVPVADGIEKLSLVGQPKSLMQCQALAKATKGECVVIVEEVYPDGVRIALANDQNSTRWIKNPPLSTKP